MLSISSHLTSNVSDKYIRFPKTLFQKYFEFVLERESTQLCGMRVRCYCHWQNMQFFLSLQQRICACIQVIQQFQNCPCIADGSSNTLYVSYHCKNCNFRLEGPIDVIFRVHQIVSGLLNIGLYKLSEQYVSWGRLWGWVEVWRGV